MPYKDPKKAKAYKKEYNKCYYQKDKEGHRKRVKQRKEKIRKLFKEYKKSLSCALCNDNRHYVLQFHHKDGIEDGELYISGMVHDGYSMDRIVSEVEKRCDVLCANCHLEVHHIKSY